MSTREVPRVALTKAEAATSLGMSIDSLERHVLDEVRVIRKGKLVLIPVLELERCIERNAALTLADY